VTPPAPPKPLARALLALLVAAALWLRASRFALAPTAEEVSDVYHGALTRILQDSEIGVNPPLLKLVLNGLFECTTTLAVGRALSVACGTAAVAVIYALTRRLARGDERAALLAAAILALHPYAIQVGSEFRAYAPLSFALSLHLLALASAVDQEAGPVRTRWLWVAALTAAATSQLHYLGLAVMGALGLMSLLAPRWRVFMRGYLAAGASMIPWVVLALGRTGNRQTDTTSIGTTVARALSTGLRAPQWVLDPWDQLLPKWLPGSAFDLFPMAVLLGVAALTALRTPLARAPGARPLWVLAGSSVLAMAGFSVLHHVRTPATMLYLVPFAALVSLAPLALPSARAQWAGFVALGLLLGAGMNKLGIRPETYGGGKAAADIASRWHELDDARQGGPMWIAPYGGVVSVWFAMSGHAWDATPWESRCDPDVPCFVRDGVQFRGLKGRPEDVRDGVIVAADHQPEDFAEGCVRVADTTLEAWTCRSPAP
jgi:hypothetical protein